MPNFRWVVRPAGVGHADDRVGRLAGDALGQPEAVEAQALELVDDGAEAQVR